MPTSPTAPSAVPDFPAIGDASYNSKAFAWATHMDATYPAEMQALATTTYNNAVEADADATTATTKAAEAVAAASAATTTANASAWVNGGTYALNANAISGVDFQTYRKKTASSVTTTDPSADGTNWVLLGGLPDQSGHSGQFLTTDGSVASWGGVPASALTLLATLTPTAAANVDFLSAFSSTYDNYLIIGQGILPASDDSLRIRFAVAGAADSAANYYSNVIATAATSALTYGSIQNSVYASGKGVNFEILVENANATTSSKTALNRAVAQTASSPSYLAQQYGTTYPAASVVSGFQLLWVSGSNFQATGTVRVYGYANT